MEYIDKCIPVIGKGFYCPPEDGHEEWPTDEVSCIIGYENDGECFYRLPEEATYLLFAQGEAHPSWAGPDMGMQPGGIIGETIIGYAMPQCGDPNHPYPQGDLNQDCRVDLLDFAAIALHWLECTAPE